MSLESCIARGKALLGAPSAQRDGLWAYELCKLSREIIEDVLECCAPPDYVEKDILSLMAPFPDLVRQVMQEDRGGSFANYIGGFEKNIKERLSRLQNYAAGIPLVPSTPAS